MSLLGPNTALVSIGCSCQTAWQLNRHVDLVSELLDEQMVRTTFPYDWLIMPPQALISWMTSQEVFPCDADAIVQHPNFSWPRHGLYFWHEFTSGGRPALTETFHDTKAKFRHLFENLHRINASKRRIFIMSNTQNNLDHVRDVTGCTSFAFDVPVMRAVMDTINAAIPGLNEFLFVAHENRSGPLERSHDWPMRVLSPDSSEVFGDDRQWSRLLAEALLLPTYCKPPIHASTPLVARDTQR